MKLGELLAIPVGLFVVKQLTDRIQDEPKTKDIVSTPTVMPRTEPVKPLIPTPRATPSEPITPIFTVDELAEQKAFIARQAKQTREQLLSRFGL